MQTNKKYKSSVFSLLFSEPGLLRELYCALCEITLPPDAPVSINTLEDVLFMDYINEGRNKDIATRCKKLSEYSAFVAKVRSYEKDLGSRKEAIKEAVKYCQKHDILGMFLKLHAGEVLSMLFTEWKLEDAIAVAREEAREDGRKEGIEYGIEKGRGNEKIEIARNLLAKGSTLEFVQDITGLDMETVKSL